jgi:glycosyltransferase involved in cell wall biosynthesis
MPTVGLCMIVKNEAPVIERCLESVRPLIDYALVEDTGSADGTQKIVADWLAREGVPGQVIEEPWRDFAYNRSHVLARLREVRSVDYALIMDADDVLRFDPGFDPAAFKAGLSHDVYDFAIERDQVVFRRAQLCASRIPFRYRGVLHEFLDGPAEGFSRANPDGLRVVSGKDGARSRNPNKYRDDAAVLERALQSETDPYLAARYRFYLAESYVSAGDLEPALANYLARAELGQWREEVYVSLYQAALLRDRLGAPPEEVIAAFARAAEADPARAEPFYGAARYCLLRGRFAEGYEYARRGLAKPQPPEGLFIEAGVYRFGLLDALAVTAYQTGRWAECAAACDRLLTEGWLPASQRARVAANRAHAADRLREAELRAPAGSRRFLGLLAWARAKEAVRQPVPDVLAAYAEASAAAPDRAEALHDAARLCRSAGLYEQGRRLALDGLAIPRPQGRVEAWIYDYGLLDELMANAFWAGRYAESAEACERLLASDRIPADMRERLLRNRQVLTEKLAGPARQD